MADKIKLGQHEFNLLNKLASAWWLAEFDGLDKGRLELGAEDVGGLDFENVVSKCDQVCDSFIFHVSSCL